MTHRPSGPHNSAAPWPFACLDTLVRGAFGDQAIWQAEPMAGGASTRRFFRIRLLPHNTTLVAFFTPDANRSDEIDCGSTPETGRSPFLEVQRLLTQHGVRVPALCAEASVDGWVLVEDLGDDTLAVYLAKYPEKKTVLYRAAVCDLAHAQAALAHVPADHWISQRVFDATLLAQEMHHFREWALEARGLVFSPSERSTFDTLVARLAGQIAAIPRAFVHRDYQSRNLMVRHDDNEQPYLLWIDFQDALLGPRIYDIVSLLNDSYQSFERSFVEDRLRDFAAAAALPAPEAAGLVREFDLVTLQRKMKDAGRFIYLDKVKNNASFLAFFKPTLARLFAALDRLRDENGDVRALGDLLSKYASGLR